MNLKVKSMIEPDETEEYVSQYLYNLEKDFESQQQLSKNRRNTYQFPKNFGEIGKVFILFYHHSDSVFMSGMWNKDFQLELFYNNQNLGLEPLTLRQMFDEIENEKDLLSQCMGVKRNFEFFLNGDEQSKKININQHREIYYFVQDFALYKIKKFLLLRKLEQNKYLKIYKQGEKGLSDGRDLENLVQFESYLDLESNFTKKVFQEENKWNLRFLYLRRVWRKKRIEAKYHLVLDCKREKIVLFKRVHNFLGNYYQHEFQKIVLREDKEIFQGDQEIPINLQEQFTLFYDLGNCDLYQLKKGILGKLGLKLKNQGDKSDLSAMQQENRELDDEQSEIEQIKKYYSLGQTDFFIQLIYSILLELRKLHEKNLVHSNLDLNSVQFYFEEDDNSFYIDLIDLGNQSGRQRKGKYFTKVIENLGEMDENSVNIENEFQKMEQEISVVLGNYSTSEYKIQQLNIMQGKEKFLRGQVTNEKIIDLLSVIQISRFLIQPQPLIKQSFSNSLDKISLLNQNFQKIKIIYQQMENWLKPQYTELSCQTMINFFETEFGDILQKSGKITSKGAAKFIIKNQNFQSTLFEIILKIQNKNFLKYKNFRASFQEQSEEKSRNLNLMEIENKTYSNQFNQNKEVTRFDKFRLLKMARMGLYAEVILIVASSQEWIEIFTKQIDSLEKEEHLLNLKCLTAFILSTHNIKQNHDKNMAWILYFFLNIHLVLEQINSTTFKHVVSLFESNKSKPFSEYKDIQKYDTYEKRKSNLPDLYAKSYPYQDLFLEFFLLKKTSSLKEQALSKKFDEKQVSLYFNKLFIVYHLRITDKLEALKNLENNDLSKELEGKWKRFFTKYEFQLTTFIHDYASHIRKSVDTVQKYIPTNYFEKEGQQNISGRNQVQKDFYLKQEDKGKTFPFRRFIYDSFFQSKINYLTREYDKARNFVKDEISLISSIYLKDDLSSLETEQKQQAAQKLFFLSVLYEQESQIHQQDGQKLEEATNRISESLKLKNELVGEQGVDIGNTYLTKGQLYFSKQKPVESLDYMRQGRDIILSWGGLFNFEVASAYNNSAYLLPNLQKIEDSLKLHKKSLEIRWKIFGEIHNDVALSYNNLAMTYSRLQKYDKSKQYQEKCLVIWKKVYGENTDHTNIATAYNNLASNESILNNYDEALNKHKEAYKMKRRIFGLDQWHQDVLVSLDGIGIMHMKKLDYDKAMDYQKINLSLWNEIKTGSVNQNYAISLNNLSQTYKRKSQYLQSFFLIREAHRILKAHYKNDANVTVKNSFMNVIQTYKDVLKHHSKQKVEAVKQMLQTVFDILKIEIQFGIQVSAQDFDYIINDPQKPRQEDSNQSQPAPQMEQIKQNSQNFSQTNTTTNSNSKTSYKNEPAQLNYLSQKYLEAIIKTNKKYSDLSVEIELKKNKNEETSQNNFDSDEEINFDYDSQSNQNSNLANVSKSVLDCIFQHEKKFSKNYDYSKNAEQIQRVSFQQVLEYLNNQTSSLINQQFNKNNTENNDIQESKNHGTDMSKSVVEQANSQK